MDDVWLSAEQDRTWRDWMGLDAELNAAMQRDLQADGGLSVPDFQVLAELTESAGGQRRITELAASLQWQQSRLSHHVKRMENRDLVTRDDCADDGRGSYVRVTDHGRAAIERAAPGHARTVRRLVFDHLTADEVRQLGEIFARLRDRGA